MTNQQTPVHQTALAKINDTFVPMITNQLQGYGIPLSEYGKQCVVSAVGAINGLLESKGKTINDIDKQDLTAILLRVGPLELNANATPREIYFITRNNKNAGPGKPSLSLEMGVEGDGNDKLLSNFGRNVKQVHKFWEVRENDGFKYPKMKGLTMEAPEWEPTGKGKVVRVVYPIQKNDGTIEYLISERDDVLKNLLAHVSQNLMWDKSGKKAKFYEAAKGKTVDEILDSPELVELGNISKAWAEPQARESMMIRKMRNNAVKPYPKDFNNNFVASQYIQATDEAEKQVRKDVTAHANQERFEAIEEPSEEPQRPDNVNEDGEIVEQGTLGFGDGEPTIAGKEDDPF